MNVNSTANKFGNCSMPMHRTDFYYDLPEELIAQEPLPERSASRLLCLDGNTGAVTHGRFTDVLEIVQPEDLLVFNNTRVIPARLYGVKQTGGRVEILIERLRGDGTALAHVRASKSPKPGSAINIAPDADEDITDFVIRVDGREGDLFLLKPETGSFAEILRAVGHMPLPPYIQRADAASDRERYQTVYAERDGAVAAPTAGLHFDEALLADLRARGVAMTQVTLHVGAGTFQPVRAENITDHKMHSEWIEVTEAACVAIDACRQRGGRVIAVGTTAVRSLETAAESGELAPFAGESELFLYPGKPFHVVDAMITNFHLPESTLIMMISAFAGYDHTMAAYREAVQQRYRFFSYGDAMFVTRANASV